MEDAVLDTGLRWVDTFGVAGDTEPGVDADGKDVLGREVGPTITLTDGAKENFMLFAAGTGHEQAVRFQGGLTHYGDQLIHDALHPAPDEHLSPNAQSDNLKSAMTWVGRAEGRMEAANIQSIMNSMGEEQDGKVAQAIADNREIASNKAAATFVTSLASSGLGAIPGAGPFIGAGLGATTGPLIDGIFQEHPVPDYESYSDNVRNGMIEDVHKAAEFSRDYRFACHVAEEYANNTDYADLYRPDGTLRPFDLSAPRRTTSATWETTSTRTSTRRTPDRARSNVARRTAKPSRTRCATRRSTRTRPTRTRAKRTGKSVSRPRWTPRHNAGASYCTATTNATGTGGTKRRPHPAYAGCVARAA